MAGLQGFPSENGKAHGKHREIDTRREIVISCGICTSSHAKRCPRSCSEVAPAHRSTTSKFPPVSGAFILFHVSYSIYHISPHAIAE